MDSGLALMNAAHAKLKFLGQKHQVTSENIANSDTPNYKARTLVEPDFETMLKTTTSRAAVRTATTHPDHMRPGTDRDGSAREIEQKRTYEVSNNENAISTEEQLIIAGQTMMEHRLVTNIYNKQRTMMQTALGRQR